MQLPDAVEASGNQVHLITATEDVERAVIDLVGDLATYRPGGKVVIFEGGGDSEFDLRMTTALFPNFQEAVNSISGGDKRRVRELHELLDHAAEKGELAVRFFSIVDRDSEEEAKPRPERCLAWGVYHIENYLLNARYIQHALQELSLGGVEPTEAEIDDRLLNCARQILGSMVKDRLQKHVNSLLVQCIDVGTAPNASSLAPGFRDAVERSAERIQKVLEANLTESSIADREQEIRQELQVALTDNSWRSVFRGRDILRRLTGELGDGVNYDHLRNLIIARMRDDGYQPEGMKHVIDQIMNA